MTLTSEQDREFDLEEFKVLREEILQKVDAVSKLERIAVGGASAIYAWLATHQLDTGRWIWFVPFLLAAVGWSWATKIGHQAYLAGQYILILERRLRPEALSVDMVYDALPDQVKLKTRPDGETLPEIHGWEGFIRVPAIRKRFL